jgi:DNA-binding response OmpR family regulator
MSESYLARWEVIHGARRILLTRTEYSLLDLRMRRPGRAERHENLIEAAWGFDSDIHNNTLKAFIRLLRAKVDAAGESKLIQTVRVGCCLREERV